MNETNFDLGIKRVLKQIHPENSITKDALDQLNFFLNTCVVDLTNLINVLIKKNKRRRSRSVYSKNNHIITVKDLTSAVKILLPSELSKHAIYEGNKAVKKLEAEKKEVLPQPPRLWPRPKIGKKRKEIKSGLVFPIAKVEKLIRENTKQKLSSGVSVFMTAVIEYLCAEILELSGNVSRDLRTIRITPRNIFFAVDTDDELSKLLEKLKFKFTGGVMPHIHSALFYQKSKKSKKNKGKK